MCFGCQDSWLVKLRRIYVHRNAMHSLQSGRENVPALLLF